MGGVMTRIERFVEDLRKDDERVTREWSAFMLRHGVESWEDMHAEARAEAEELAVKQARRIGAVQQRLLPWTV